MCLNYIIGDQEDIEQFRYLLRLQRNAADQPNQNTNHNSDDLNQDTSLLNEDQSRCVNYQQFSESNQDSHQEILTAINQTSYDQQCNIERENGSRRRDLRR
ncbi:hypothetical protein ABPG72_014730 [Tetrahymena utriculariae]